ncbi:MAG: hypothetical protein NTY53_10595 [Kiritimatiellaeota bacterium]|nr:hypothetical protein [Kiritimatiellota bacterium]
MTDPRENVFQLLQRHGVVFAVIGGHAVSVHGFIRATEDHDIVFLRTPENEQRLLKALQESHARWISDERDPATGNERQLPVTQAYLQSQHLMMLLTDAGFLDIFDYIPGSPEASVEQFIADGLEVAGIRYASREWLLRMKRAAGRPQDLLDIENLQAL